MRRTHLVAWSVLAVGAGSASAQEPDVSVLQHAFVEVRPVTGTRWRDEVFTVRVRLGLEQAFRAERLVSPFAQALDVPVQLDAPAWRTAPPWSVERRDAAPSQSATLVWNDERIVARRAPSEERAGLVFDVFEVVLDVAGRAPGRAVLAGPTLHLRAATRFEPDVFGERRPVDPRAWSFASPDVVVDVRDWPSAGRPSSFHGAVGSFAWTARPAADGGGPDGDVLRVRLTLSGSGNFPFLGPPDLTDVPGWHVLGILPERAEGSLAWVVDARRRTPGVAFPPIPYAFLPPGGEGTYAVATTAALELGAGTYSGTTTPSRAAWRPIGRRTGLGPSATRWLAWIALFGPLPLVAFAAGVRAAVRRLRTARAPNPHELALQRYEHSRTVGADPEARLVAYLADRLRCPEAALIGPALVERLRARGVPDALARRAAEELAQLTAARYGGRQADGSDARVDALVRALHAHLEQEVGS